MSINFDTHGGRTFISRSLFHRHYYDINFSQSDFRVPLGCVFILEIKLGGRFCSSSLFFRHLKIIFSPFKDINSSQKIAIVAFPLDASLF